MKPLQKAIFPVAGLGTRFLPATKSIPKEMLTVVDRPLIQYAVDEAVEAGIDTLIFVTGRSKNAIVDYFDRSPELEAELEAKGKLKEQWGELTDDDFNKIEGKREQLVGLVQERYGLTKDAAEKQIVEFEHRASSWLDKRD